MNTTAARSIGIVPAGFAVLAAMAISPARAQTGSSTRFWRTPTGFPTVTIFALPAP